jgi:hypothetical protein
VTPLSVGGIGFLDIWRVGFSQRPGFRLRRDVAVRTLPDQRSRTADAGTRRLVREATALRASVTPALLLRSSPRMN